MNFSGEFAVSMEFSGYNFLEGRILRRRAFHREIFGGCKFPMIGEVNVLGLFEKQSKIK